QNTARRAPELMRWEAVPMLHDNCVWKPPGTNMHQDGSYLDYLVPPEMVTCWIALDDTSAEAGTITYAAGSHHWPRSPENRAEFHAPADWLPPAERPRPPAEGVRPVPAVERAGGAALPLVHTVQRSRPHAAAGDR